MNFGGERAPKSVPTDDLNIRLQERRTTSSPNMYLAARDVRVDALDGVEGKVVRRLRQAFNRRPVHEQLVLNIAADIQTYIFLSISAPA